MTVTLPGLATNDIVAFVLVLSRVGGLFALAPVFSAKMIPLRAKVLLASAVSLALMPLASHGQHLPSDAPRIALLILKEAGVGLAFAFALAALAAAVQSGAALLDTVIGFSFAALVDPINNQQNAVLGEFYTLFATMIFLAIGGDHLMLMGLARTYEVLPLSAMPDVSVLAAHSLDALEQVLALGLEIVAPAVLALVVTDAALGVVARAVPQMNVFVVGLPAKLIAGFAVIAASLPFVAIHLQDDLQSSVLQALQTLHAA